MRMKVRTVAALLALLGLATGSMAAPSEAAQEGVLSVQVPAGEIVKGIEVYLDNGGGEAREEQVAPNPNSLLSIGRVRETMIDVKQDRVSKGKDAVDQPVLFYLYSPTTRVGDFEIDVMSARTASQGIFAEGTTPKGFVLEALELGAIGDTKGKVLKRFDDVAFKVGETNKFPLDVELKAGRVLGVRIWAEPGPDELSIQIKASKKGKYPAHILRRGSGGETAADEGGFNPDIAFTYQGAPSQAGKGRFLSANPLESLAEQINNYVKAQGKAGAVTVPLRVRVETASDGHE